MPIQERFPLLKKEVGSIIYDNPTTDKAIKIRNKISHLKQVSSDYGLCKVAVWWMGLSKVVWCSQLVVDFMPFEMFYHVNC